MNKQQFLGASLHTGLKVCHFDANRESEHICKIEIWHNEEVTISDGEYEYDLLLDDITPILRPLSDLTKPITHNGETFVPMIKLLEMERSLGLTYATLSMKVTRVSYNESGKFSTHNVEYTEPYTNMDDGIITFSYSEQFRRFGKVMSHPYRQPLSVGYQIDLFLKLIEWHFNIMDESEPFIPVTDDFNPYK